MKITHLMMMSALCITQAHAFNLPRQPTKSYDCDVCDKLSHDNLQDKWGISSEPLAEKVSNKQKSVSYREMVTLKQLRAGIKVPTLAPGAVLRITPLQNKAIPELKLKTPTNQILTLKEASSLYSEDEAFGNEVSLETHQKMIQIKTELGSGMFVLKSNDKKNKDTDAYMINVFDKFSSTNLQIETTSLHYQYGDNMTAIITLDDNEYHTIDEIDVALIGPAGQEVPLKLTRLKFNQFKATAKLLSEVNDHGENWYVEANILSETGSIRRSGHTAFSYSVPSATLISVKKLSSKPLTFVATLDVATASRYSLQSVLFRRNGLGQVRPVETSQKAQWLEPGKQVIQFTFDNSSQLTDDSLSIGYLRLTDYGQLKTVYQYNQPIKLTQLVE